MYTSKQPVVNIPKNLAQQALDGGKPNNRHFSNPPTSGGSSKFYAEKNHKKAPQLKEYKSLEALQAQHFQSSAPVQLPPAKSSKNAHCPKKAQLFS
jgi:hypothetical protein